MLNKCESIESNHSPKNDLRKSSDYGGYYSEALSVSRDVEWRGCDSEIIGTIIKSQYIIQ